MPRQVRIQYPGAMYHVMSRGNRRQEIYLDDIDPPGLPEDVSGDLPRIMSEELGRLGWPEAQLALRPKRDPSKLEIAVRLRRETTLSVKEIAARLHLGTPASASLCLLAALRKTTRMAPTQGCLAI